MIKDKDKVLSVFNILESINNTSSKLGKADIISKNSDDTLFVQFLYFIYNPYFVTGLSTKKMNKDVSNIDISDSDDFINVEQVLDYLMSNGTGRDYDIAVLNKYSSKFDSDVRDFLGEVFAKTYKCGATKNTINSALGYNLIPSFGVSLAESYEKKEDSVRGHFFITLKIDGNRALVKRTGDKFQIFTRKGIEMFGFEELSKDFMKLPTNYVYDGELIMRNTEELDSETLFQKTQSIVRKDENKENIEFLMFDTLPLSEFESGESLKSYSERRRELDLIGKMKNLNFIKVLPVLYQGNDKSMIEKLMVSHVEPYGYEGLMLNKADSKYQTKRTSDLLKIKKFKYADLIVTGVYEGEGEFKGTLGGVTVDYKGFSVGLGSGFKEHERKLYWSNPELIINKIVLVRYFNETKNKKNDELSIRFPSYKGIREDKGIGDVNYG